MPAVTPAGDANDLKARLAEALSRQYVIERVLGQGGMGTVFLARDVTLDRDVAVKVVAPEVSASQELRQRFILEARTVAKLRHPNIVAVYSAGEASGLLYFVMEYVPGESLRDRMTRDVRASAETAIPILHDLALALDYAHQAGIVHRDVKPENVLLDQETGRAMLTDFGVARALAGDDDGDGRLTGTGFVLGSPRYMSPEQAGGERGLDGRSDQYSLGLIGYEMFAGAPAIDADTAASVLVKQLTETPMPLAQRAPDTPGAAARAIDRALSKSPVERFASGASFAAALVGEPFDADKPAYQGNRGGGGARTVPVARAGRRRLIVAAFALVVLLVGLFATYRRFGHSANARTYFVAPFEIQTADRSLDWLHEGSVNMLTLAMSQWTDLSVVDYERSLDLLRNAQLDDSRRIGLDQARAMARKVGAGTLVMGLVTSTTDSLHVVARLYDVNTGALRDQAQGDGATKDDPRLVFQNVANDLLDIAGGPKTSLELAHATSTSVNAYRAYLEGLRFLNVWRLADADSLFALATRLDTTFALAYYKRSVGLGWVNNPDRTAHVQNAERAVQFMERLPRRQQEIVQANRDLARGFDDMNKGDFKSARTLLTAAQSRLATLVKTDSLDAEAWYGLADADFHAATSTGQQSVDTIVTLLNRSQRGFRRAIALDSTFHLAYQHLVGIYQIAAQTGGGIVVDGDTLRNASNPEAIRALGGATRLQVQRETAKARGRDAAAGWLAADPDAAQAYRALSDSYGQLHQWDSSSLVLERAMQRPRAASPVTAYRIALLQQLGEDPRALTTLRDALRKYGADSLRTRNDGERAMIVVAGLSIAAGNGAVSMLDTIARTAIKTDSMLPFGALRTDRTANLFAIGMRVGMGLKPTTDEKRTLASGIDQLDKSSGQMVAQLRAQSVSMPYIAYLATRDPAFAATARRWSNAQVTGGLTELDALEALDQGDTARAARLVREFPSADSLAHANLGMAGLRLAARAEAAEKVGDLRRAVGIYEAIDPKRFSNIGIAEPGFATYARSFLERGRLYEALGERIKAINAYETFATKWKNADAPLQPQVRFARDAAQRLRDPTSTVPVHVSPAPKL